MRNVVRLAEKRNGALPCAPHPEAVAACSGLLEPVDVTHKIAEPAIKVLNQIQPVIASNLQSFENRRQVELPNCCHLSGDQSIGSRQLQVDSAHRVPVAGGVGFAGLFSRDPIAAPCLFLPKARM